GFIKLYAIGAMLKLIPASSYAEIQASLRNDIDRRSHIRQYCRVAIRIARHHKPNTYTLRQRRICSQQRPALQTRPIDIPIDGNEMIEEPGMFNKGNLIGFLPDTEHTLVACILWGCFHTKR